MSFVPPTCRSDHISHFQTRVREAHMARVLNGGGYMTVEASVWRITDETRDTGTKTYWRNLIVEVKPPVGGHEWRWSKNERGEDENEDARDANEKIDGRARIGTFARQECTYIDDLLSGRVDFSITTPNVFRLQTLTEWLAHARTVWNPVFSGSRTAGAAECGVPEWWFLNEELPPSRGVATLPITVSTPPATTTSSPGPWAEESTPTCMRASRPRTARR